MRKSLWSPDEDEKLRQYVAKHGCGNWSDVAKHTGLHRCGKSCRLRWINYLRPDLKRGPFTAHEVRLVVSLHNSLGNSWSKIATHLPGRTDNDVKNFWHSYTRSRRLQQQQRQRMDNIGLTHIDSESYNATEETHCYSSELYNSQTISAVKKESRAEEHGYGEHQHRELQQLPPLMFTSANNMNKGAVNDCRAPSMNVDNAPPFHFGIGNQKQSPYTTNTSIPITNTDHSNHLPHYSAAHLPSQSDLKATNLKPIMIHNHLQNVSECPTAAIYKGNHSHVTPAQTNRNCKLGSMLYATSFDHSSSSTLEATSSAVSASTTHMDCQTSFDLQRYNAADHEWSSLTFSPSMHVNYLNSQGLPDHPHATSFDQANSTIDSKPPDGLHSVIWRFLNQQDANHPAAAAASATTGQQRAHNHHHNPYPYSYQKPNSVAIDSILRSSETDIQPLTQLPFAEQLGSVEEAFSSSASLQYLQAQYLAADCLS